MSTYNIYKYIGTSELNTMRKLHEINSPTQLILDIGASVHPYNRLLVHLPIF